MNKNDFTIIERNPTFEESLRGLPPTLRKEIEEIKEILKKDPAKIAKPLRGKLKGKYKIYLGKKRYRLVCRIELNTKKIFLLYVRPRTLAYSKE